MKKGFIAVLFLLFLAFPVMAIEPPPTIWLGIEGTCHEFNVTVSVDMFDYGCYDVKVDVFSPQEGRVGEIYDPVQGWKSSMYYIYDGLCIDAETSNGTFKVRADTDAEELNFMARLRDTCCGMPTWDSGYYNITQQCDSAPEGVGNESMLLVLLLVVLILLGGITFYVRWMK